MGWLHEAARPRAGGDLGARAGKAGRRRCQFVRVYAEWSRVTPKSQLLVTPPLTRADVTSPPRHRQRRDREVREFRVFVPTLPLAAPNRATPGVPEKQLGRNQAPELLTARWWEEPVALGLLLVLLPPAGVAAAWRSPRYSDDARWALVTVTTVSLSLMTLVAAALLTR